MTPRTKHAFGTLLAVAVSASSTLMGGACSTTDDVSSGNQNATVPTCVIDGGPVVCITDDLGNSVLADDGTACPCTSDDAGICEECQCQDDPNVRVSTDDDELDDAQFVELLTEFMPQVCADAAAGLTPEYDADILAAFGCTSPVAFTDAVMLADENAGRTNAQRLVGYIKAARGALKAPKRCVKDKNGKCANRNSIMAPAPDNMRDVCSDPKPTPGPKDPGFGTEDPAKACAFYLNAKQCLKDCSDVDNNRLLGYYQTCMFMGTSAFPQGAFQPPNIPGGGFNPALCQNNKAYTDYVAGMRNCLQTAGCGMLGPKDPNCYTCSEVVNGVKGNATSGIIGVHTACNATNSFCGLVGNTGGKAGGPTGSQCFGAALAQSWGAVAGTQSLLGFMQAVGLCHSLSQLAVCAKGDPAKAADFLEEVCTGYQTTCNSQNTNGCEALGIGRELCCSLSCPKPSQIIGKNGVGLLDQLIAGAGIAAPQPPKKPVGPWLAWVAGEAERKVFLAALILLKKTLGNKSAISIAEGLCTNVIGRRPGVGFLK